jgi:CubicO group peptidase (beta-lactamase class C family)
MSMTHDELKEGSAESVGMSEEVLDKAGAVLAAAIEDGLMGAASLVVGRHGTIVFAQGYGYQTPDEDAPAVESDSVFLLASITKPVTACALLLLVERGLVSLNDPVSQYLPEFQGGERDQVRVRHLLSHTSGMPDMLPQNKGILLAAEIVERVSGQRLRDFEKQEIFDPLGMSRSALGLGSFEIADTVWCGMTKPETGDGAHWGPNSPYWRDIGCPWGGMHSSGADLAILLQTMLNRGEYGGRRVFSVAAVETMTSNQNSAIPNAPWGLGWALAGSRVWNFFGELVSPATFGHVGATGTVAWADPDRQLLCVVLTNQMVEGGSLLRRVSNVVSAAVMD